MNYYNNAGLAKKLTINTHNHWLPAEQIDQITTDALAQSWLLEKGSITLRLKQKMPDLQVQVLEQGLINSDLNNSDSHNPELSIQPTEAQKLGLIAPKSHNQAWLRTVLIQNKQQNLIYARTVIPNFQPANPWYQIQQLGNKPLGEILFTNPDLTRSSFEFSNYQNQDSSKIFSANPARRCVFQHDQFPLLLTEVFLEFI